MEAEFDRLPFADAQFDLAVFNSSLHYSTDYHGTLERSAALPASPRAGSWCSIRPLYKLREHGERMRDERHQQFQAQYGFPFRQHRQPRIPVRIATGRTVARAAHAVANLPAVVWLEMAYAAVEGAAARRSVRRRDFGFWWRALKQMIILLNPRATRPKNRRYPLSLLAIAAVLEGQGGVRDRRRQRRRPDAAPIHGRRRDGETPEMLAVTVMPGPQMVAAIPLCRAFRRKYPTVPIVWGGYFPSLYHRCRAERPLRGFRRARPGRGHVPRTARRAARAAATSTKIRGLSYKDQFGLHVHNPERPLRSPGDFPWYPVSPAGSGEVHPAHFSGLAHHRAPGEHRLPVPLQFLRRGAGVRPREDRAAERTAAILAHLQREYGVNAVQFYDNNFFLREDHARELAERLTPLGMRWWCEGRVDVVLGYSDETLRKLRQSGCVMIFFGVESGSDEVLTGMRKQLKSEQILAFAERIREFGIVPEYSFIFGDPRRRRARYARDHRLHPQGEEDQSGYRDHRPDLRAHAAARRHVRQRGRQDAISHHARRVGHRPLVQFHGPHRSAAALAARARSSGTSTISKR